MRHFLASFVLVWCVLLAKPGAATPPRPAGVVADFLAAEKTGLGESMSLVLWHDVLSAIDDSTQTHMQWVPRAQPPPPAALRIPEDHKAAEQLAQHLNVGLVLWGAVVEQQGRLLVDSSVTLNPTLAATTFPLRLHTAQLGGLEGTIPRARFNFAPTETSRAVYFGRPLRVRRPTVLRTRPRKASTAVGRVDAHTVVHALDMVGDWWKVQHRGDIAYIQHHEVEVLPHAVEGRGSTGTVYAAPSPHAAVLWTGSLQGRFPVLARQYHAGQGWWYRLTVGETVGWVSAAEVRPVYALPAVHFVAGLILYRLGHYPEAAQAYEHFLARPNEEGTNNLRAAAYQMLGLSQMKTAQRAGEETQRWEAFSHAITLTPYNATAYTLRALAMLHNTQTLATSPVVRQVIEDSSTALDLDARDPQALALAQALVRWAEQQPAEIVDALQAPLAQLRARRRLQSAAVTPPHPAAGTQGAVRGPAVPAVTPLQTVRNSLGMEMVLIPAGEFQMGSVTGYTNERPIHTVRISRSFYLGKYEVTQGQWQAVMGSNPSGFTGDPTRPVERVSWDDIQTFLQKLNAREGGAPYRLPTKAEWEYAARAGTSTEYSFGDKEQELGDYAWYIDNARGTTHPVGQKAANAWGLHDMHGNVWEWVQDWYAPYAAATAVDPVGPALGGDRVLRGGSWFSGARDVRSAQRVLFQPANRLHYTGFRCARGQAQ